MILLLASYGALLKRQFSSSSASTSKQVKQKESMFISEHYGTIVFTDKSQSRGKKKKLLVSMES
jgi:hypothetical protein